MIAINDLHITTNPRLIFVSNSIENKGRSNKSYTIRIVNDATNNSLLDNLFGNKSRRTVKFEAKYVVENITMIGKLYVTSVDKQGADAIFVSGNGQLWESMQNMNLREYDWSALDHELNYTNVIASESSPAGYVYDLCDRGAFKQEQASPVGSTMVDVTERFPAINLMTIIETVLHQEGYGVRETDGFVIPDVLGALYLLYTQEIESRNTKNWPKDAIFEAEGTGGYAYTDTGTGNDVFSIATKLRYETELTDVGGNFTGTSGESATSNIYTAPEAGTYRFVCNYNLQFQRPTLATVSNVTARIAIQKNGSDLFYKDLTIDLSVNASQTEAGILDTKYIRVESGDELRCYVTFAGDITNAGAWTMTINQLNTSNEFSNDVTINYGVGDTVDVGRLMPDMTALEFFQKVFNYLNIYAYFRNEINTLELIHARGESASVMTIEPIEVIEELTEQSNYWLRFATDKAAAPDDLYFDNDKDIDRELKFDVSRTYIGDCIRVFVDTETEIPILWDGDKDPREFLYAYDPAPFKTKGNLRILKYDGQADSDYYLTYGGNSTTNQAGPKAIPSFTEPDVEQFHRFDLTLEGVTLTCIARIDISKLYDQSLFKGSVTVTGFGRYFVEQAEQLQGDVYKLILIK